MISCLQVIRVLNLSAQQKRQEDSLEDSVKISSLIHEMYRLKDFTEYKEENFFDILLIVLDKIKSFILFVKNMSFLSSDAALKKGELYN